jgi:hypothetical protein
MADKKKLSVEYSKQSLENAPAVPLQLHCCATIREQGVTL